MKPERGIQGHHRSETPVCHRCSLPLLADAEYCPYCEQPVELEHEPQLDDNRRRPGRFSERAALAIGVTVFAVLAVATFVIALAS